MCFAVALLCLISHARADVGVVLADPTGIGVSVFTHAGHALVYLSGICPETPVRARLCNDGEQGSVVTTYPNFREDQPYAWNLVPLSLYLQGSMKPDNRLLYGSHLVKAALEDRARQDFLREVCGEAYCPQIPHSFWRDIVGATTVRDIFIFAVHTTREQDEAAVAWLNSSVNVNHYNGVTNNCAVFTRSLVNLYFPHAVHRDFPNDLGMMAPKAAARSFTRWAKKRPELGFYTMHFAQVPGDMPRSDVARSGTENAIRTKWYLIAAAAIGDHEVAGSFFVSYFLTGRFGVYKEYSHHTSPTIVAMEEESRENPDAEQRDNLKAEIAEEQQVTMGDKAEWESFRSRFAEMKTTPEVKELLGKRLFPEVYDSAEATVDADGSAWMSVVQDGISHRVGVSSNSVLADGSDSTLAFQLMLGRVGYALHAKNHIRETMPEFREDWTLMEQARAKMLARREDQIRIAQAGR